METLKREDFIEEIRWTAKCPKCGEYVEIYDNPEYETSVWCGSCDTMIDLD